MTAQTSDIYKNMDKFNGASNRVKKMYGAFTDPARIVVCKTLDNTIVKCVGIFENPESYWIKNYICASAELANISKHCFFEEKGAALRGTVVVIKDTLRLQRDMGWNPELRDLHD